MFRKKGLYHSLIFLLFIGLGLSISFATAAQDHGKYGGTVIYGTTITPPTLDWHWSTAVRDAAQDIFEGFVAFDANDVVQPMLAKEWEVSEDELTWTFYLREGIMFHNGKEMTSEDAVASARRWAEIGNYRALLEAIDSINAIDKYTVEFKLKEKLGALPPLMAQDSGYLVIMPKEVCEGVPGGELAEYIGTGPYRFKEWELDRHIKLERFENYQSIDLEPSGWSGRKNAYFDEIIYQFVPEASTLLVGLETEEFDTITPVLPLDAERLKSNKDIVVQRYPKWGLGTVFNTKGIFQSQKLRSAVIMALDMEEIMFSAGKKQENIELIPSVVRRHSIWYTGQQDKYYNQMDIEGAKKLMQEAGYNGEEIVILTSKDWPWAYDMAIPIQEQMKKIGFNVRLDVVDWPTLVDRRSDPEGWDIFTSAGDSPSDPLRRAQNLLGNYAGWYTTPELTERFKDLLRESSFEKRFEAWSEIERITAENPDAIRPGFLFEFRGNRRNIKGIPDFKSTVLWNAYRE